MSSGGVTCEDCGYRQRECQCGSWPYPRHHQDGDKWPSELSTAMHNLARCLRDAGALCAADVIAARRTVRLWTHYDIDHAINWRPGCHRNAPGYEPGGEG